MGITTFAAIDVGSYISGRELQSLCYQYAAGSRKCLDRSGAGLSEDRDPGRDTQQLRTEIFRLQICGGKRRIFYKNDPEGNRHY